LRKAPGMKARATEEYLDMVNEALPTATAIGAYAIGVVTTLAWQQKLDPTAELIRAAAECPNVESVLFVFENWLKNGVNS